MKPEPVATGEPIRPLREVAKEFRRAYALKAIAACGSKNKAAKALCVHTTDLYRLIK